MKKIIDIQDLLVWAFRDESVSVAQDPPADALAVYWAVKGLPRPIETLVSYHANEATEPAWDPVDVAADAAEIDWLQLTYSSWITGMLLVRNAVVGTLESFEVIAPRVDPAPWLEPVSIAA